MELFDRISRGASVFDLSTHDNPSPRSKDSRSRQPFSYLDDDDTERISKEDIDEYWKVYKNNPIVRETINMFASRIVEDGYYLEGDNEEMVEEVSNWLESSAILEGEYNQEFVRFIKKAIVQREVKGTVLIEKVKGRGSDELTAFKFIPPEGMDIHTMPEQSILVPPEKPDDDNRDYNAPVKDDGKLAAYEQSMDMQIASESGDSILFTRDEVLKIVRDADIGDVKGTSRLEAIKSRANGLHKKLEDNDEAIASKAYPLWLFKFGSEDNPWKSDRIESFMSAHEMENFHPGMKQGVRGDVDVDTISGEVSDIAEYLQFDVDFIMAAMPMPKYTVGFEQDINQFVSNQQQTNLRKQVREARNEIEDEFEPAIREKAKDMGYSEEEVEELNFYVGAPNDEDIEEENVNVIRYLGVDKDQRGAGEVEDEEGEEDGEENTIEENVWSAEVDPVFELQGSPQAELSEMLEKRLRDARESLIEGVREDMDRRVNFDDTSARVLRDHLDDGSLENDVEPIVEDIIELALPEGETFGNPAGMQRTKHYAKNISSTYDDIVEEMFDEVELQIRRGAERAEELETILERVRSKFNDDKLSQRSSIISHMEMKNIQETTKLEQFERDPEVVGYRFVNEDPSTELSSRVDGSEVYFEEEEDYVEQLEGQVSKEFLRKGFSPIPSVPPVKFGDTTTIEPIRE